MNSFETDLKRAFFSVNFLAGLLIECFILWRSGFQSEMFRISVPVLSSLPYTTAWLGDYKSVYIKAYLPRSGTASYILGKFLSCGISGGALLVLACMAIPAGEEGIGRESFFSYFSLACFGRSCRQPLPPLQRAGMSLMAVRLSCSMYLSYCMSAILRDGIVYTRWNGMRPSTHGF